MRRIRDLFESRRSVADGLGCFGQGIDGLREPTLELTRGDLSEAVEEEPNIDHHTAQCEIILKILLS